MCISYPEMTAARRIICGKKLLQNYKKICHSKRKRRDTAVLPEKEATTFLVHKIRKRRSLHEECCLEGCSQHEIAEAC